MFNKRAEIDNLKLKVHKLKLDVSDRDREISLLNSGIKELSKYYSERCSKPYVSADMVTNIKLDTAKLVKSINELKDASHGTPHIRIDIPTINDYPRVYVDGKKLTNIPDSAVQKLSLDYDTGTISSGPAQNIDVQYVEIDANGKWSIKHHQESTLDYEDDSKDGTQMKIHELSKYEQPKGVYANNHVNYYYADIINPETIALLDKPNTRLAIIEDDANA